jgi:hypothetical protein
MNDVKFSSMTIPQLVSFYNRHSAKPVNRFSDRKTAERRCAELFESLLSTSDTKVINQVNTPNNTRPVMKDSLKLDRTLICLSSGEIWKNAYQMWRERPEWLTSAQQDRLTAQLYAAAKIGEQKIIQINERSFMLVSVSRATV